MGFEFENKHLVYLGTAALVALVVYNSTRKVEIEEVADPSVETKQLNFDAKKLPFFLKPPKSLEA